MIVLLPHPLLPTSATTFPAGIENENPWRITLCCREGFSLDHPEDFRPCSFCLIEYLHVWGSISEWSAMKKDVKPTGDGPSLWPFFCFMQMVGRIYARIYEFSFLHSSKEDAHHCSYDVTSSWFLIHNNYCSDPNNESPRSEGHSLKHTGPCSLYQCFSLA